MDQLDEIKQKIDIISFISEYLPLKKAGRNFRALCPFHGEKTPSFVVSPERQIWHCFGCNLGGDIFSFLMKMENLEFPEALEILAKRAGITLVRNFERSEQMKIKDKIYKINHLASEFYHYLLLNHQSGKKALAYVLGRGVKKPTMETFSLGWAPPSWDSLTKFLLKKGYSSLEIEQAGLIVRSGRFYDRFRGRLMFALRDHRGNVIGFAGRTLDEKATEAKYINTSETPVYIKGNVLYGLDITSEAIKKQDNAVIVEGEFDLISSFQAGVANVVAIKGSALTEGQLILLKRFTQNITLSLDTDLAGDAASRRGIEAADNAGFSIKVVKLPSGKDPDECARRNPALWQKAVKSAVPVFDYFIDSAAARFDKDSADGKKKISDEIIPILSKIANPIIQSHYLSRLAKILAVSEEAVAQAVRKVEQKKERLPGGAAAAREPVSNQTRQEKLEEHLLALILQGETLGPKEELTQIEEFLTIPAIKKVFQILTVSPEKKFVISELVKSVPAELTAVVDRAYLQDLNSLLQDEKLYRAEWQKTALELKRNFLRLRLFTLAKEMAATEEKLPLGKLSEAYRQTAAELKKINSGQ